MPVRGRLPSLALAVPALLFASGCGDGGDDAAKPAAGSATATAATSTPVAPAAGDRIAGTGYRLNAAPGWTDVTQQLGARADVILATQSGSVFNVLREKLPADTSRSQALNALARSVLSGAGASRRSASSPTTLDGAGGITFRVRVKTDLGQAPGRVVIVIHDGYAYAIAGSTSPDEPVSAERALQSMLSSWRWT